MERGGSGDGERKGVKLNKATRFIELLFLIFWESLRGGTCPPPVLAGKQVEMKKGRFKSGMKDVANDKWPGGDFSECKTQKNNKTQQESITKKALVIPHM